MNRSLCLLPLIAVLSACSLKPVSVSNVYQLYGQHPAEGPEAEDGVFQDFTFHNENLAHVWIDTDAVEHEGDERASLQPWIDRQNPDEPFLRVVYDRQGYGVNMTIGPYRSRPELIPDEAKLVVTMRSKSDACVGIRIQEGDGEVWFYGKPALDYFRQCVEPGDAWNTIEIPLSSGRWSSFPYAGNLYLGNKQRDFDVLTAVTFELGSWGQYYFHSGQNTLDIKSIEVR